MATLRKWNWHPWIMGVLLIVTAWGLAGCGKSYWYSATKDVTAFRQDRFQCEEEAAVYSSNMGSPGKKSLVKSRLRECMALRGYSRADEDHLPAGVNIFE